MKNSYQQYYLSIINVNNLYQIYNIKKIKNTIIKNNTQ